MDAIKLKARDLMQPNVARLDAGTPVEEGMSLLESDRISGAPVVDAGGGVIGVFSLSDVARAKEAEEHTPGSARSEYYLPDRGIDDEDDEFSYKEDYSPAALPSGTVSDWMTREIVAVSPGDSVRVACKRMRDEGIHRVLVVEDRRLVGLLSSSDVVRWIADHG